jgi:hypothetical protein
LSERLPVEAETHRNNSSDGMNIAGIHILQGVEDVKAIKYTVFMHADHPHSSPTFMVGRNEGILMNVTCCQRLIYTIIRHGA